VLADAGRSDEVVFLGDIVGYGPHPSACVDLLAQLDAQVVLGNHDRAVLAIRGRTTRRSPAVDWDEWTFDQLDESHRSYLAAQPTELTVTFCGTTAAAMHHPPGIPYLHPAMPDSVLAGHLQAVSHPVVVCGHSHRAIDRVVNGHRYVCIPHVGQPRDVNPQAGYAVEEDGTLLFRFVGYEVERVVEKVRDIGLADTFCERWVRFLQKGWDAEWSRDYQACRTSHFSDAHKTCSRPSDR